MFAKKASQITHDQGPALVVGATSALARSLCKVLAGRGYPLILAARDAEELSLMAGDAHLRYGAQVRTVLFDYLDPAFSPQQLLADAGEFSHLFLVSGSMGGENTDITALAVTSDINYLRPAQIASLAAQQLEQKGGGDIVLISSVAGDRGRQSNYAYGAAKAALTTFAAGLRNAFFARGVHVMTVKPGFIDSAMTWGMQSPLIASPDYVAKQIVAAMEAGRDIIYVPFFWRYIMLIITHIPERIFKKMKL